MALQHEFKRQEILGSYFMNRAQDFLSAARTDLRLSVKDADTIQIVPDPELGLAAIAIQGRWRWVEKTITRDHPGGAKGTFTIWAVAKDNEVDNTPKPLTDHTDYAFDLRITKGEEAPSGSGVVVFEKIGEIDWSGTEIEALRQTHGSVTGPMIESTALSSETPSDITWTRAANGGLIAGLKKDSVGANEIMAEGVGTAELALLAVTAERLAEEAVTTGKMANLAATEAKLANEGVATGKIKNLAVTAAKIANEAVSAAKIAEGAVIEEKLGPLAVGTGKLANLAVTAAKLAALAVEEAKIADGAVTSRKAKLTCGLVEATESLTIASETFADIVGAKLEITPPVASKLKVTAVFDVEAGSAACVINGGLNLDGSNQVRFATFKAGIEGGRTLITQIHILSLTAALHTIKLVGRRQAGTGGKIISPHTAFIYELVAS
jgi:hypothetical protein